MIEQIRLVKSFQMQYSPLTAMATTQAILCEVGTDATLRHHEADIITLPSIQYDKRIPALPMMMSPRLPPSVPSEISAVHSDALPGLPYDRS